MNQSEKNETETALQLFDPCPDLCYSVLTISAGCYIRSGEMRCETCKKATRNHSGFIAIRSDTCGLAVALFILLGETIIQRRESLNVALHQPGRAG
jgi:hypothetical protein